MDFQNYDDYMRNTLGFSGMGSPMGMQSSFPMGMQNNSAMGMNGCCSNMNYPNMCITPYSNTNMVSNPMWQTQSCDLEKMYPDCYKVIYPMVISACRNVAMPITEEDLDRMTDDIYDRAVTDNRISVNITVEVDNRDSKSDSEDRQNRNSKFGGEDRQNSSSKFGSEDRQMLNRPTIRRPHRNRFLRDLIRILLLRELIGGGRRPRF